MMRSELGWFDLEENRIGVLTTKLSSDPGNVARLWGNGVSVTSTIILSLVTSILVGFFFCPGFAVVSLLLMPLLFGLLAVAAIALLVMLRLTCAFCKQMTKPFDDEEKEHLTVKQ